MRTVESLNPKYKGAWWEKLPQGQTIKVLAKGFVIEPPETPMSRIEKRVDATARYSQAVRNIIDYILDNEVSFPDLDESKMNKINNLGILSASLTPAQCGKLIESGLVETIYPDKDIEIFLP